jgi:hypothetical protein
VYGRSKNLRELEQRRADRSGDKAQTNSVREQKMYRAGQERSESTHKRKRQRSWRQRVAKIQD